MTRKKRRSISTTKRVLYGTLIVCGLFIMVIIAAWVIWDRTDAAGLAGMIAAPAAVVIGFYEWKAKAENLAKYGKKDEIKIDESGEYTE